jgi:hypothetical protein
MKKEDRPWKNNQIKQEAINVETLSNKKQSTKRPRPVSPMTPAIKQGVIDSDGFEGKHTILPPAKRIKSDLMDLDLPFSKRVKIEEVAGIATAPSKLEQDIDDNPSRIKIEEDTVTLETPKPQHCRSKWS